MPRFSTAIKSHRNSNYFKLSNEAYAREILEYLNHCLKYDLGKNGDITTKLLDDSGVSAIGIVHAKESGVCAGMEDAAFFVNNSKRLNGKLTVRTKKNDGDNFHKGDVLCEIRGPLFALLESERTLLNFIQRMCGIATFTANCVKKVAKYQVLVCPTRKTAAGAMDKKACINGGGGSHRINLSDAYLIKNNHIDNGLDLENFEHLAPDIKKSTFIEIETRNETEIARAAKALANLKKTLKFKIPMVIMFDNMPPAKISMSIAKINKMYKEGMFLFEASGGINNGNIEAYAKTGVDIISMGALTNAAPPSDISMKIVKRG